MADGSHAVELGPCVCHTAVVCISSAVDMESNPDPGHPRPQVRYYVADPGSGIGFSVRWGDPDAMENDDSWFHDIIGCTRIEVFEADCKSGEGTFSMVFDEEAAMKKAPVNQTVQAVFDDGTGVYEADSRFAGGELTVHSRKRGAGILSAWANSEPRGIFVFTKHVAGQNENELPRAVDIGHTAAELIRAFGLIAFC